MNDPVFVDIKKQVGQWLESNKEKLNSNNIFLETLRDNENCIRVELNFGKLLAEILIEKPTFAPYRYVSFQAGDIINGVFKMVYSWYDQEGVSIESILENLDKAIDIVWEYNNKKYIV